MTDSPMNTQRDLEPVGSLIDDVVAAIGERSGMSGSGVLWTEWAAIGGREWADTEPGRLENGVLTVRVADGMAATRLRYATAPLLSRISQRIGMGVVTSIRIKLRRPDRAG